jgi:hypothetical protein
MEAGVGIELPRGAKRKNISRKWTLFKLTRGLLSYTRRILFTDTFTDTLQIYPTNSIIGVTMTNRYRVLLVYPDNSSNDVTAAATLTNTTSGAQVLGLSTNNFRLVQGTNQGTISLRAVYQGMTNTVSLASS